MYLLDTNVLSALRRRDRTDPNVAAWADSINPAALYLSTITVLEIELGALTLARRDAVQGNIRPWIFKDRISDRQGFYRHSRLLRPPGIADQAI